MSKIIAWLLGCIMLTLVLAACENAPTPDDNTSDLVSIKISPANQSIINGFSQQFTATGTYSDNSIQDITDSVVWTSSDPGKISISGSGLATGNAIGIATIVAAFDQVSGNTVLTITSSSTPAEINWATVSYPRSTLYDVLWSGAQFVAVGAEGTVLTSSDGVAWTARLSGTTEGLTGISWSGKQFVVVGNHGTILTSPDGMAWTARSSGTTERLAGISWSGKQFVAVGNHGTILTSSDGLDWTKQVSGETIDFKGISWSGKLFLAWGKRGTIRTSSDGITWTDNSLDLTKHEADAPPWIDLLVYSGTQFFVFGKNPYGSGMWWDWNYRYDFNYISTDGVSWTYNESKTDDQPPSDIAWSGARFAMVSQGGIISSSLDGINWTGRISGTSENLYAVTWSGTQFVAVGQTGTILSSPDGITWTSRFWGHSGHLNDVVWSGTQFAAVGDQQAILTSPDGLIWTNRFASAPPAFLQPTFYGLSWTGGQFVAAGGYEPVVWFEGDQPLREIFTSTDGVTWDKTFSVIGYPATDIVRAGNQFVLVGKGGHISTSPNGITWKDRSSGTSLDLAGIAWSGTQYVVVGQTGSILTSPDGVAWVSRPSGTSLDLADLAWTGEHFVAVGQKGTILTSPDGVTWLNRPSSTSLDLADVTWSGMQYVAVGQTGTILTSLDGYIWTSCLSGTTEDLAGSAWSGEKFVVIGANGTILMSK